MALTLSVGGTMFYLPDGSKPRWGLNWRYMASSNKRHLLDLNIPKYHPPNAPSRSGYGLTGFRVNVDPSARKTT